MAKNLLFALLFCGIYHASSPLLATNKPDSLANETFKSDNCDAPAPDSFHVTTSGYNFVTLAWQPAWPGATHTLVVLTRIESTGAWVPVDTIFNVSGASYMVSNMQYEPAKSGYMISTNCIDGEPGDEVAFGGPPVALILELIIAGRTPNDPSEVDFCKPLNVSEHNWIGFSVSNVEGFNIVANTFEVIIKNDHPVVKRVNDPPLVAGNDNFDYPKNPPNNFINFYGDPPAIFKVFLAHSNGTYTPIGWIKILVSQLGPNKTVTICQDLSQSWNNTYFFKVLTATSADGFSSPQSGDRIEMFQLSSEKVLVQTPFGDNINIFLPESFLEKKQVHFSLWDATGQLVFEKQYESISKEISIPMETLPIGNYFLHVVSEGEHETIKISKVD